MNRILLAIPAVIFTALTHAQEPAPAAAEAEVKPAEETAKPADSAPAKRYDLKNRSVFNIADGTRAPFHPIGWVKRTGAVMPVVQEANVDASGFRLTSILIGNPSLAVINGRSYEEGQFLRMPRGGPQLRIRLYRIGDGQVWLQMDDKVFSVPLKRPELNERRMEEPLLNEERDVVPELPQTPVAPQVPR